MPLKSTAVQTLVIWATRLKTYRLHSQQRITRQHIYSKNSLLYNKSIGRYALEEYEFFYQCVGNPHQLKICLINWSKLIESH